MAGLQPRRTLRHRRSLQAAIGGGAIDDAGDLVAAGCSHFHAHAQGKAFIAAIARQRAVEACRRHSDGEGRLGIAQHILATLRAAGEGVHFPQPWSAGMRRIGSDRGDEATIGLSCERQRLRVAIGRADHAFDHLQLACVAGAVERGDEAQ